MKKNKKKKMKYKISLLILAILIIVVIILIGIKLFKKEDSAPVKVVDSIDNFGYTLDERDTKLMKDTYKELKEVLKASNIDYEEYAKVLAKLFVIDLFTLDNKINKYDVGSLEYVYPESLDNFKLNVEDTIYKLIENDSDGKRKQSLPIVKSIEVTDSKKDTFLIGEESKESYVVSLEWKYEKDLGYDTHADVILVAKDNRLYVVSYNVGDANE